MPNSFDLIAAKLAEHEIALSETYAQFARTFPVDVDLWTSMSRDETKHAMWIDEVRQSASARSIRVVETTATQQGIEVAITYARGLAQRCRDGKMTRRQAHALARDVENGMLERRLFDILSNTSPEFGKVAEALARETADHREKIVKAMARFTGPSS